jgi:hypothetical protein
MSVSAEERERRGKEAGQIAVVTGAKAAAMATGAVLAVHLVGTMFYAKSYASVPVYPKRIVAACFVVGSYTFQSQLAHSNAVLRYNEEDARRREQLDNETRMQRRLAAAALTQASQASKAQATGNKDAPMK